jgi:hypothetical protein
MSHSARTTKADVFAPPVVKPVPLQDRARDAEFAWFRDHAQDYRRQWVVLDGGKLLASGPQLRDILRKLSSPERDRDPLFHWVDTD